MDNGNSCVGEWVGIGWVVGSGKCRCCEVGVEVGNIGVVVVGDSRRVVEEGGDGE
jgi:hypothetical protein